ncbi:MAG TPA: hypothetical protein VG013_05530, partial [Gemmataceae bacterium]|nr:hypothetical protein [Gemmataceae bacterium]
MTIHTRQMRSPKPGEERRKASAEELAAMVVKRSETSDNRRNALLAVIDSGEGKRCLPMIVAVLDDADEYNRYLAYQLLTEYYPDLPSRVPSLLNLGSVDDPKDRLAVIRDVVRILPDVGAALAAQAPGWQALQRLTKQGTAEETGDPPMPPEKPPPGDDPEPAKEG